MCDVGLALGLASGVIKAASMAETADKNETMINEQARLEHAAQAREFIVNSNAAN